MLMSERVSVPVPAARGFAATLVPAPIHNTGRRKMRTQLP
jgi:hypothetical protein